MLLPFCQPFKKTVKGAAIEKVYRSASDVRRTVSGMTSAVK